MGISTTDSRLGGWGWGGAYILPSCDFLYLGSFADFGSEKWLAGEVGYLGSELRRETGKLLPSVHIRSWELLGSQTGFG